MTENLSQSKKMETLKSIILGLHDGLPVTAARDRFEREVGNISSSEIAVLEQGLIDEGLSPDEIKKFCNVHALLFQSALEKAATDDTFPSHPVYLFKQENREIEKITAALKTMAAGGEGQEFPVFMKSITGTLAKLKNIEKHYERKEQLLFPYLEKKGFMGPSKVMWGKDNEVRDLLKAALSQLENVTDSGQFEVYAKNTLLPLVEEIEGMIFKEENILFPTALEKLSSADWVDILGESDEIGYGFIEKTEETDVLIKKLQSALLEEPVFRDNVAVLPTGSLYPQELMVLLNTLPVDMTFVDKDDTVKYFSGSKDRIFHRTKSIIGRKVQNCHPPQSVDVVEKILTSFKEGKRDHYDFWINLKGKTVYIRYFAMRDKDRNYLGTIEVTQDITGIKNLQGERRLLDERD